MGNLRHQPFELVWTQTGRRSSPHKDRVHDRGLPQSHAHLSFECGQVPVSQVVETGH